MTTFPWQVARTWALTLALAVALGACSRTSSSGSAATGGDEQAIRGVFLHYQEAIGKRQGETAANLVSEKTLAYYERMRVAALSMPAAEVKSSPLMDRMMTLLLRARVAKEDLKAWHGRELFVQAVAQGWVGEGAQRLVPDEVSIDGSTASLGMRSGTSIMPPAQGYRLYQEAGGWKLDIMSIAPPDGPGMKAMEKKLAQIDPNPERALEKLTEKTSGKPVSAAIWEPLDR